MMGVMDQETTQEKLAAVLVDASTVAEHAERLLASAENHPSVLPADFMSDLGVLVEELRNLRDDLRDVRLKQDGDAEIVSPD
jgi:hypothetical protein